MNCSNCGNQIKEGENFCNACGTPVIIQSNLEPNTNDNELNEVVPTNAVEVPKEENVIEINPVIQEENNLITENQTSSAEAHPVESTQAVISEEKKPIELSQVVKSPETLPPVETIQPVQTDEQVQINKQQQPVESVQSVQAVQQVVSSQISQPVQANQIEKTKIKKKSPIIIIIIILAILVLAVVGFIALGGKIKFTVNTGNTATQTTTTTTEAIKTPSSNEQKKYKVISIQEFEDVASKNGFVFFDNEYYDNGEKTKIPGVSDYSLGFYLDEEGALEFKAEFYKIEKMEEMDKFYKDAIDILKEWRDGENIIEEEVGSNYKISKIKGEDEYGIVVQVEDTILISYGYEDILTKLFDELYN